MIVWVALAMAAVGATVTVAGDDPCDLATIVPTSLAALGASAGGKDHVVALSPGGGILRITLTSSTGAVLLERTVPHRIFACEATADGVALVVERYVRDLGWTAPATAIPPKLETSPVAEARPFAMTLNAAALAEVDPGSGGARFGGALAVRLRLEIIEVALEIGGLSLHTEPIQLDGAEIGVLEIWSVHALVGAGACLALPSSRLCGSGRLGLERLAAQTSGARIFGPQQVSRFGFLLAPGIRYDLEITDLIGVSGQIDGLLRPVRRPFSVEDASAYTPPVATLTFGLGAWVRFY